MIPETPEVTVVYVEGRQREDCAVLVFQGGKRIHQHHPLPRYGDDLESLVQALTGKEPEVVAVQQIGEEYPETLEEMMKWPKGR